MNYVVKPGETLAEIAAKFHTTVEEIVEHNPRIHDPNLITPGEVLHIPHGPMPHPVHCPVLKQGFSGHDVVHLQKLLKSAGFDPGDIDGIFGPKTEAAVLSFQKSKSLVQDGIVGRMTWAALGVNCSHVPPTHPCPILNRGDSGPSVVKLQELLHTKGFAPGTIDGIFGPKTEAAVLAFQKSRNLVQDGIVGPMTWGALGVHCS